MAQSVARLTHRVQYPVRPHTFVSPSADSRRAVVSYWRKYVHEVLPNRLGDLSLPRKSVDRLTDRPDMTGDVYRGRQTTTQQQQQQPASPSKVGSTLKGNKLLQEEQFIALRVGIYLDWLVGCFGFNGPLRQYFSLYRAVSQREGERGEKGQMREKMSKQPQPAPAASATGPCPTIIQISRTPRHWKITKHLRTTRPPPPI